MSRKRMSVDRIHRETAHVRHKIAPHAMDFSHYPLPFKRYAGGDLLSLEQACTPQAYGSKGESLIHFLQSFLYLSYGVTAVRETSGHPCLFRTVPSAGGLYPCHLYLGLSGKDSGETGLYYYDPAGHELVLLRQAGGGTAALDLSAADPCGTALYFVVTAWLYNSAWKYRERSLRYLMLDAGHLVENLVLAGSFADPCVSYEFSDAGVAEMLGLDLDREVPLALGAMNWDDSVSELGRKLCQDTEPVFPGTLVRPAETAYMAGLMVSERIRATGGGKPGGRLKGAGGVWRQAPMETMDMPWAASGRPTGFDSLPKLMIRRRSRRNFVRRPVSLDAQQGLMGWVLETAGDWGEWITLALACQDWEGLEDGLYAVDPERGSLDLIMDGNLHPHLARVCLGQEWAGMAGAVFLCLADLEALDLAGGMRAYRYAMLAAGRAGQRIYLGAEASGMGCCGIGAIYDDEAAALLGLNRASALLYALAAGPVKKHRRQVPDRTIR